MQYMSSFVARSSANARDLMRQLDWPATAGTSHFNLSPRQPLLVWHHSASATSQLDARRYARMCRFVLFETGGACRAARHARTAGDDGERDQPAVCCPSALTPLAAIIDCHRTAGAMAQPIRVFEDVGAQAPDSACKGGATRAPLAPVDLNSARERLLAIRKRTAVKKAQLPRTSRHADVCACVLCVPPAAHSAIACEQPTRRMCLAPQQPSSRLCTTTRRRSPLRNHHASTLPRPRLHCAPVLLAVAPLHTRRRPLQQLVSPLLCQRRRLCPHDASPRPPLRPALRTSCALVVGHSSGATDCASCCR